MEQFIERHGECIVGVLEGFDRVLFRGTLLSISYAEGLDRFLGATGVLLKNFKPFVERCTATLASHAQAVAARAGRPYRYLLSPKQDKEALALSIARQDGVERGLICVLSSVEPCMSFEVYRDREAKRLKLVSRQRKCRFFYFYYLDAEFGLMHVRLQSWLPCDVQVCINGRSYLQRQMDRARIGYRKADNCFTSIDDLGRAQRILDRLVTRDWRRTLDRLVAPLNPLLKKGGPLASVFGYYWTIRQSEYATDVMFTDAASLARVYPGLYLHAIEQLGSDDLLRFLGKKRPGAIKDQVVSDLKRTIEGVRVKHHAGANSIKMYDKQGSVLRIETTVNDPSRFRVWRRAQGDAKSKLAWRRMRKGVADIARRVEVCRGANHRYLQALAVVGDATPVHRVLDPISRPVRKKGQAARPMRPVAPDDAALFAAVMRGEHLLHGFTNADVQAALYDRPPRDEAERRQRSNAVGYRLRLLRRHGMIRKVARTRRYRLTLKGHTAMATAQAIRTANALMLKAA